MSSIWPTAVATDSNLYIAVNSLETNLSGSINNSVTTIGLNSTSNLPTVGTVLVDSEVIKYTGISGSNLTGCTRGFDGTTAVSHSSGAVVSFAVVADHHNVLKNEIEAVETTLQSAFGLNPTFASTIQTQLSARLPLAGGTMSGNITFSPSTGGKVGTPTNDDAASGIVGEYISSAVQSSAGFTSGNFGDITSISLTAGDWDVSAVWVINNTVIVASGNSSGFIGLVSGNNTTGGNLGDNQWYGTAGAVSSSQYDPYAIPTFRIKLATTTTVYLKGMNTYSSGTPSWNGRISARRVR